MAGIQHQPDGPRLTVVGGAADGSSTGRDLRRMLTDGTAATTVGGMIAGGFGVEAAKSLMTGTAAGRWWLILLFAVGLALVATGIRQRRLAARRLRVGIVVTATDARRERAHAEQRDQQAAIFSRRTCAVTLRTSVHLTGDRIRDLEPVDALADQTLTALTMAERLTPDATWIRLIPTMPLHVAFRFGAKLGHTHARHVAVHAIRQADGDPPYFAATVLRAVEPATSPLRVERPTRIDGGDLAVAALALDLQGRGDQFFDAVEATCREHRIGHLLRIRSNAPRLAENDETFTGVVEQVCRAWLEAPLPAETRTGRHAIFLSGSVAIALALGARLAAPEHDRWTAYTFDSPSGTYEPFPAIAAS